ncbi:MAG: recombination protein RecR, partial [candidate division Zixibacteria bacterium]|nr:recombination protein RecR [candidate division Zixibacteria bacterium]
MFRSAETVERLISLFRKLPGVGPKSAGRLAFHILKMSTDEALELAETIKEVKEKVGFCDICQNISETSPCYICNDPKRDKTKICVVEEAMDVVSLEKVEGYRGL